MVNTPANVNRKMQVIGSLWPYVAPKYTSAQMRRGSLSMYESSDLRKGLKIEYEGDPYIVVQFDFVKPGKGQALYKCRLQEHAQRHSVRPHLPLR